MGIFDDMLDAAFASDIGESASYTPAGGQAASITVIPRRGDELESFSGTRIKTSERAVFDIRKSELAAPAEGDAIVHAGLDWVIKYVTTKDDNRLIWVIECIPGA